MFLTCSKTKAYALIGGYLNANPVTDGGSVNNLSGGGIAAIFFFYLWTAFYIPSWNGTSSYLTPHFSRAVLT